MGLLDDLGELVQNVNDVASDISKSTIDDYGEPEYTLYTARKLEDIHREIDIFDEDGNLRYYTKSAIIAITGKTDIMDEEGKVIAHLEKKPISLHQKHFIDMKDGRHITLSTELFHIIEDITNIEELGWQIKGNIIAHHFNILDENGEPVATVGRQAISIHDKYSIGIYQPVHEEVVVAIVIQLEKMLADRDLNSSSSSFSTESND